MKKKRRKLVKKVLIKDVKECEHKNIHQPFWYYKWCKDCKKVFINPAVKDDYFLL